MVFTADFIIIVVIYLFLIEKATTASNYIERSTYP